VRCDARHIAGGWVTEGWLWQLHQDRTEQRQQQQEQFSKLTMTTALPPVHLACLVIQQLL
jgi:hypothetical protein